MNRSVAKRPARRRTAVRWPAAAAPPEPAVSHESPFWNRELSWLEFNDRVLAEAAEERLPLLERLKFLAIFESNLDEFVMKRVGGLQRQVAGQVRDLSPDGRTPRQQLEAIRVAIVPQLARARRLLADEIAPALAREGVELLWRWQQVSSAERKRLASFFSASVFPVLTPLGVDTAHPFPHISNLSLSLAAAVVDPDTGASRFARVKVPASIPRWVRLGDELRFLPLEELIAQHLDRLFPGMELAECYPFRVTRNAAVESNEEAAADLIEAIQDELQERRFAPVVRLEVVPEMPQWMRALLEQELELDEFDLIEVEHPLALRDLFALSQLPLPRLQVEPWRPITHPRLASNPGTTEPDPFATVAGGDLLVHHPYDSFATSVQRFLQAAAIDPQVLAIKQTLYRTSRDSPVVKALIEAAERGKQVAVIVELKARFDEERNIEWAEALEEAGAHVAYGVVGFKTHAKVSLVVRQEGGVLRTYGHLATGNYNTDTAELYTDLGLFTCRSEIGADLAQLFNLLTGFVRKPSFERLWVAPYNMRARTLERIAREVEHARAGRGGRLIAKMNSLEDLQIIRALYDASAAGVEIDLLVRGICRLKPGAPGLSERIRVMSIVGRFLEHARIFCFANAGEPEVLFGSADWMSRNLDRRVEAMVPVDDPEIKAELRAILDLQLADNCQAWDLLPTGEYRRRTPAPGEPTRSSQQQLIERTLTRARRAAAQE